MTLFEYLKSAKKELFRFEALQNYDVPQEVGTYSKFIKTGEVSFSEDDKEWWSFIKNKKSNNIKTERVRLLKFPITDYSFFELMVHQMSVICGDEIKIILSNEFNKLDVPIQDFWLINNETVLIMNYDDTGKYIGFDVVKNDVNKYVEYKDKLLQNSVNLYKINYINHNSRV